MAKLYLQRHLKSQWNLENRFAGWVDNPLSKESNIVAEQIAKEIEQISFSKIYSSALFRNMDTIAKIFDFIPNKYPLFMHVDGGKAQEWANYGNPSINEMPVCVSEKLNERSYGELQGLDKAELMKKYGEEKLHSWRRNYNEAPPGGESGKDTYERVVPFFKEFAEKDLKEGKDILVVASHGSLRVIIKYLENMTDEDFGILELPFGALVKYDFENGKYKKFA
jgi:2,3-bisphosphoglycerate-dependent phosphoglycerate mutase